MKIMAERFYWNKNLHWFIWPSLAIWRYKNKIQVNVFFLRFDFRIEIFRSSKSTKRDELPITKKYGLMDI
jgi:hypothetical protein